MRTVSADRVVDLIKGWGIQYDGHLHALERVRPEWSAEDILNLPGIRDEDKLTLVVHPEFLDDRVLQWFALICAEKLLKKATMPSPKCTYAVAVKRKWLFNQATDSQMVNAIADASSVERRLDTGLELKMKEVVYARAIQATVMAVHFNAGVNADNCSRLASYILTPRKRLALLRHIIYLLQKGDV